MTQRKRPTLSQKNKGAVGKQDYEIYNATLKGNETGSPEIHDNVDMYFHVQS